MCGIIGLVKERGDATGAVYEGLKRLEYRGYDSAGIAAEVNGEVVCRKHKGGVETLKDDIPALASRKAMGHTRWATHGEPSDINAHPHTSGRITVVHNGIVENYREIAERLSRPLVSETDSEVVAALIDCRYAQCGKLLPAVASAVKELNGSFALCVMCADFDGLIAVRYKSSLVVGYGKGETFVVSDIPALPPDVCEISLPPDGTIAVISNDFAQVYDFDLRRIDCPRRAISVGQYTADKGNFPHFMLKEIGEDGQTVSETSEAFSRCESSEKLKSVLARVDRIIITGCGTAYNAGLAAKPFFEKCGAFCCVEIASELRYFPPAVTKDSLVIAVSQSGETADTVEAASLLRGRGAKIIAVTNCGYSAITRVAHAVVPVCAHAEICVAATKSYIGQIAALYMLAGMMCGRNGAKEELAAIVPLLNEVIAESDRAKSVAEKCANSKAVFFLGRGYDYPAAVEASLKLKEVSYVFSDAYPAGELKHGTLALVDENTLAVFIICVEETAEKCVNAVEQVLSRKGNAVMLTCLDSVVADVEGRADVWKIPRVNAPLAPLLCAAALQQIAYYTAVRLGRNPDKPRNLAKSVTVE